MAADKSGEGCGSVIVGLLVLGPPLWAKVAPLLLR